MPTHVTSSWHVMTSTDHWTVGRDTYFRFNWSGSGHNQPLSHHLTAGVASSLKVLEIAIL